MGFIIRGVIWDIPILIFAYVLFWGPIWEFCIGFRTFSTSSSWPKGGRLEGRGRSNFRDFGIARIAGQGVGLPSSGTGEVKGFGLPFPKPPRHQDVRIL